MFAFFRPSCKTEARFGRLPSTRAARTVVEGPLARECGLKTDQTDFAPNDRECVLGAIHQRTAEFLVQLQGDALAEAKLPPEAHADIQQGLTAFGFFNGADDGKFGPSTRTTIRRFLKSRHLPQNDFLSADQRVEIHRKSQTSISSDTLKPVSYTHLRAHE